MSDVSSAKVYPGGVLVKGRDSRRPPIGLADHLGFQRNNCIERGVQSNTGGLLTRNRD
jgi:hypothetical protein